MKKLFLIIFVTFLCGCAARHVSEINRIQEYGANSDEQKRYVKEYNAKFDKLLESTKNGTISTYKTEADFEKNFGEPIFVKNVSGRSDYDVLWLYRYCEKLGGSEKVYLYFDAAGNLVSWEYVPGEKTP